MRNLCKWLMKRFFWIWSYSPILAFTDDYNCYEYDPYRKSDQNLRISILNLLFGDVSIYFFTCSWEVQDKIKFDFVKVLHISDNPKFNLSSVKENDLQNKYIGHILADNIDAKTEEKAIETQIRLQQSRLDKNYMRISIYVAMGAVVIPYLLNVINEPVCINQLSLKMIVLRVCYLYAIVNLIIMLFDSVKIAWTKSCLFSDLKKAKCQSEYYLLQRYIDWQYLKRNADQSLTFSHKIQDLFYICIVLYVYINIHWTAYFDRIIVLMKELWIGS